LPPYHTAWSGLAERYKDLIERAGVFDGLQLIDVNNVDWNSRFSIAGWSDVKLPEKSPYSYETEVWEDYKKYIYNQLKPYFDGNFVYEIQELYSFPGLEKFNNLSDSTKNALMRILLFSIPHWGKRWNWKKILIKKVGGQAHSFQPVSPIKYALQELQWLIDTSQTVFIKFCPKERWYISATNQLGGFYQFSHLKPIPANISRLLNFNDDLVATLKLLGMPKYESDPDIKRNNALLLDSLTNALDDQNIDIINTNIFLGQVRLAWTQFEPISEDDFPKKIIFQNGMSSLKTLIPSPDNPIFLPNGSTNLHDGLKLHSKPMVAIERRDAKRLDVLFRDAYGDGIIYANELSLKAQINGSLWELKQDLPNLSSEISWLPPIVMTIFAYLPGQRRGTGTKRFLEAMDDLRKAKIDWVENLEAGIWRGDECIARTEVYAIWNQKNNTLIAVKETIDNPHLLSESLSAIVNRADLDIALKLVLGDFSKTREPTNEDILNSLTNLRITRDRYDEVLQKWLGDLSWTLRLIGPAILAINSDIDISPLNEITSEESLLASLLSIATIGFE